MRLIHRYSITIRNDNGGGWVDNLEAQEAIQLFQKQNTGIEIITINDIVYHRSLQIIIYYYDWNADEDTNDI